MLREEGDPDGARSSLEAGLQISRRNGDQQGLRGHLVLACLAADLGDWAGQPCCKAPRRPFVTGLEIPWQQLEARYRQDSLDQVRARLGEEQLQEACARGMRLSLDQALDLAFGRPVSA